MLAELGPTTLTLYWSQQPMLPAKGTSAPQGSAQQVPEPTIENLLLLALALANPLPWPIIRSTVS